MDIATKKIVLAISTFSKKKSGFCSIFTPFFLEMFL